MKEEALVSCMRDQVQTRGIPLGANSRIQELDLAPASMVVHACMAEPRAEGLSSDPAVPLGANSRILELREILVRSSALYPPISLIRPQ